MGEGSRGRAPRATRRPRGATDIPRKPNYDFERRERERAKAAESAKKAQAKADKREADRGAAEAEPSHDP